MAKALPIEEVSARIEAALYSAGRPLSVDELVKASGSSRSTTLKVLNNLIQKAKSVFSALEVKELADGTFVFQLKPSYSPMIRRYAQRPLIPASSLKTLSYITYEQPVTSKRLLQIRGSQVYSHLRILRRMGFIEYENQRPRTYRTTRKFQAYFGLTDIESLKSSLPKYIG
ncbi:SMC-Scp complex subunit ScpB [Nitrososphaera sp. AFS]|uniref:SMC-Scp complex subunit ScpB n=1 Tax=Nitrososphaera sp. AFS TaxID=2301191 RepID=UPI00139234AA|nr:SMC-Scp complex subunit ScpB [Nitrososphaera sp. AFS]NAL76870.1 SMC-Scp complex subunit ScpB [Nitrososphaera sp. AFS]